MSIDNEIFRAALTWVVKKQKIMTQLEVAGETCIAQSSISGYISGRTQPKYDYKISILNAFHRVLDLDADQIIQIGQSEVSIQPRSDQDKITDQAHPERIDEYKHNKNKNHHDIVDKFVQSELAEEINGLLLEIEKLRQTKLERIKKYLADELADLKKEVGEREVKRLASGEGN